MERLHIALPLVLAESGLLERTGVRETDQRIIEILAATVRGSVGADREMGIPDHLGTSEEEVKQNAEAALKRDFRKYLPGVRAWVNSVALSNAVYQINVSYVRAGDSIGVEQGLQWSFMPRNPRIKE
ncbi:MAG: hypothetical protein IPM94_13410 [bacterium]|nr:hypothetical protein [bacterium]